MYLQHGFPNVRMACEGRQYFQIFPNDSPWCCTFCMLYKNGWMFSDVKFLESVHLVFGTRFLNANFICGPPLNEVVHIFRQLQATSIILTFLSLWRPMSMPTKNCFSSTAWHVFSSLLCCHISWLPLRHSFSESPCFLLDPVTTTVLALLTATRYANAAQACPVLCSLQHDLLKALR